MDENYGPTWWSTSIPPDEAEPSDAPKTSIASVEIPQHMQAAIMSGKPAIICTIAGKEGIIKSWVKEGVWQCKNIADLPILKFLAGLSGKAGTLHPDFDNSIRQAFPPDATTRTNLVRAKMRSLIKRGLVKGCACGCRGDFELTDAGREFIDGRQGKNGGDHG